MNGYEFSLAGETLIALATGALWWPERRILAVSDLHFGKTDRVSRRGGPILPPYEVPDTLSRLETDIERFDAGTVICLGDSFDDLEAAKNLGESERQWIVRLQAGRKWIWIEGNHDPGPVDFGGVHLACLSEGALTFRHIATPNSIGEISGHYHPKHTLLSRGRSITRRCFMIDGRKIILPAFGAYTGGLKTTHHQLHSLFANGGTVVMTGKNAYAVPLPCNN